MLTPTTYTSAVKTANREITRELSGDQNGLITRFTPLNKAMMKYMRFASIYTIAGASGSAKSFLLNNLRDDFRSTEEIILPFETNDEELIKHIETKASISFTGKELIFPAINKDATFKVCMLHFGFEMNPGKEIARSVCDYAGMNYSYLHSSFAKKISNGVYEYNVLTSEEHRFTTTILNYLQRTKNVLFFNHAGTVMDIFKTVEVAYNKYVRNNPEPTELIVTLDHTLLVAKDKEKSDTELINNLSKMFISLREVFGAMVIPLNQFNNEIEDDRRRSKPGLHYPLKSDIYCGGQLFQASDFVFTMLMPSKLGIPQYGPREVTTQNIIHLGLIKSRYDNDGQLWLYNDLANGHLLPAYPEYNKGKFHNWSIGHTLNNKKYKL
jgi:hypothetical protein